MLETGKSLATEFKYCSVLEKITFQQEKPYDIKPSGSKNLQKKCQANTGHAQKHLDP